MPYKSKFSGARIDEILTKAASLEMPNIFDIVLYQKEVEEDQLPTESWAIQNSSILNQIISSLSEKKDTFVYFLFPSFMGSGFERVPVKYQLHVDNTLILIADYYGQNFSITFSDGSASLEVYNDGILDTAIDLQRQIDAINKKIDFIAAKLDIQFNPDE